MCVIFLPQHHPLCVRTRQHQQVLFPPLRQRPTDSIPILYPSCQPNQNHDLFQKTGTTSVTLPLTVLPPLFHLATDAGKLDDTLIRECKEQKVVFDAFSVYVLRLKVLVPASSGSNSVGERKFITRMRDTDFFQVLSMYHTF